MKPLESNEQPDDKLQSFLSALSRLQANIEGNKPVTTDDLDELKQGVTSVPVDTDRPHEPSHSTSRDERERNLQIIEQVQAGDFGGLKKLTELTPEFVDILLHANLGRYISFDLSGLKSLDLKTAKRLAENTKDYQPITLPVLDITRDVFDALKSCPNLAITFDQKSKDSLTSLKPGHLLCLSFGHISELPAVSSITPDIISLMTELHVAPHFTALTTLDEPCALALVAAGISGFRFKTFEASENVLKILNRVPGIIAVESMDLSMAKLSPDRASFIVNSMNDVHLAFPNVVELDEDTAKALAHKLPIMKSISFPALKSISKAAAQKLAYAGTTNLYVDGLENPSADVLEALADMRPNVIYGGRYVHRLSLLGMKSITPQQAKAIATKFRGYELQLGITELSPEAARHFAHVRTYALKLNGLTSLSGEAARSLAANFHIKNIELNGLKSIRTPDTTYLGAKSFLSKFFPAYMQGGQDALLTESDAIVRMDGVEAITKEDAEFLASLPPLKQVETSRRPTGRGRFGNVAEYTPKVIILKAAADIPDDIADILAQSKAEISLSETNDKAVAEARKRLGISDASR